VASGGDGAIVFDLNIDAKLGVCSLGKGVVLSECCGVLL
jgi:hypothetical protein